MKRSFLLGSAIVVLAGSADAQQPGTYRGLTSQGFAIEFTVTPDGMCVSPTQFTVTLDCPSGARTGWGAFNGLCGPIDSGSFRVSLDPVDGAIPTYVVSGTFDSGTTAQGDISFQASHLYVVPGKDLGAQLCDSGDVTWTAQLSAGASEPIRFEGNQVVSSKSSTEVRLVK